MNEVDIAWACGLFDGEGCISVEKRHDYPVLYMSMTDEDLVRRFHEVVGIGRFTTRHQRSRGYQKQYVWRATGYKNVQKMFELFSPWIGERRKQRFKEVLKIYEESSIIRRKSE